MATDLAGTVSFDGQLEEIDGDLVGDSAIGVQSISASNLQTITGDFTLNDMQQLSDAQFPQLTNIRGTLSWISIPNLGGLKFGTGVQRITSVIIQDTQIQDLSGINLKSAQNVSISQNLRLNTLAWQLASVDGLLSLDGNGGGAGFNATFGNLASAGEIQINQVNGLVMNALKNVTGTLQIYNSQLETLYFPNLTTTGSFSLLNNANLNNITVPVLQSLAGGLNLQQNADLTEVVTFPALTRINGAVNCTGAFNELLLPKINTITGQVSIKSTGNLTQTCSAIKQDQKNNVFTALPLVCQGGQQNNPSLTGGSGSGTSSGGSTTSTAAAVASYTIPTAITIGSLFAAIFGML